MRYQHIEGTDLRVSEVCLGTWQFNDGITDDITWPAQSYETSKSIFDKARELGINFFDTAEAYRNSESVLGRCLEGVRRDCVVAAKFGYKGGKDKYSPVDIESALTETLRQLRTDYVDIYQFHWAPAVADMGEAVKELKRQQALGRIRHYGICNFGPQSMQEIIDAGGSPVTHQMPYNLLARCVEFEVLPASRKHKLAVLAYSPLQQGLLTGKFSSVNDFPEGRRRTRLFSSNSTKLARHGSDGVEDEVFAALQRIRQLCAADNLEMARAALAWLWQRAACTSVIVGCSRPDQLLLNCNQATLTQDTLDRLTDATEQLKAALGPNIDLWAPIDQPRFK